MKLEVLSKLKVRRRAIVPRPGEGIPERATVRRLAAKFSQIKTNPAGRMQSEPAQSGTRKYMKPRLKSSVHQALAGSAASQCDCDRSPKTSRSKDGATHACGLHCRLNVIYRL
jgi:hypothetical protein